MMSLSIGLVQAELVCFYMKEAIINNEKPQVLNTCGLIQLHSLEYVKREYQPDV